jgi:hypothetical protein
LLEYALFPPVLILFDHPIGVTGLSIEQQAGDRATHVRDGAARANGTSSSATPKFYAAASEYWMPAFAGMTVV